MVHDHEYGTAAEIAGMLGPDVTAAAVRNWARRGELASHRVGRMVYHPVRQAARIEAAKRRSGRGRPRQLDAHRPGARSSIDHSVPVAEVCPQPTIRQPSQLRPGRPAAQGGHRG